jgi:threonine dehydratase
MAGVAAALEGLARVVGVEPESIPTLHRALAAGAPVDVEVSGVAADSLGARRLGDIAFDVATRSGVQSVLVSDDAIVAARRLLWQQCRLVVEHGAAAAIAALLQGTYAPRPGESVAVILCGANTDPSDLT